MAVKLTFRRLPGKQEVERGLELLLAQGFIRRVRPMIRSRTLREALAVEQTRRRTTIRIPHYWAIFYHDGRGPAFPKNRFLVWFKDPRLDPRLPGRHPVTRDEVRPLREVLPDLEWEDIVQLAADGLVVIAPVSPFDATIVEGDPFFTRAAMGYPDPSMELSIEARISRIVNVFTGPKEKDRVVLRFD